MTDLTTAIAEPLLLEKNMGRPMPPRGPMPPTTNASGRPIVPLTQEQKYVFDMRGWLLIPGVLDETEIAEMQDFCNRLRHNPESIPEAHRTTYGGPLEELIDHPSVVAFGNEFLAAPNLASQSCYGFRMEMSFPSFRTATDNPPFKFSPHNGSGMFRLPGDCHTYHCIPGKAQCGLARVIWELNPVEKTDGATLFISGSHKAAYTAPPTAYEIDSPLWESYACPPGSVVFFTEALSHSGQPWNNPTYDRMAIFNAYNHINTRWSLARPRPDQFNAMPPKRQSLFREAYTSGNVTEGDFKADMNP
jgi:hypothetical protein